MPQKSFTSASKEKRGPSLRTTLVQKSRVPNGDESSEDSPSSFSFQRTRKKLSESKPFSTFSSRKKREDEVNNGQLKPRMRNTIYISPYANPYKTQRASSGIEKYQTESTNELQNSTEDRQIENDGYAVESTPGNSSTETITVERIETVQEPDDITMDNIQHIGGNSFGEDSIPYFGNLFNIDENETNIDENDMMAVVEVGRPIFVITSSESGRRRPLSQASELGRTSTQEITGISEEAIEYLFPSGLFEPRARPMIEHPDKIFPRRKEAEFDESGRPFHPLFYTVQPNFYQTLSDVVAKLRALDVHEDKMIREGKHFVDKKEFLIGEDWITADKLSMMLVEKLNDFHRAQFVKTIERLTNHNYGYLEKDYINGFRRVVASQFEALEAPDLMYNSEGRPFMTSYGRRKSCWSKATVVGNGVGKYVINGVDFRDMFPRQQDREQLLFPLQFTGFMNKVDVDASVDGGGPTGQAGAVRVAVSRALRSFVGKDMLEQMRIAP